MPHMKAVGAPSVREAAAMPIENGMPMNRASGARIPTATAMRIGVVEASAASMAVWVKTPNTTISPTSTATGTISDLGLSGSITFSTIIEPRPLNTSTVNSTTTRAYVGCPRNVDSRCSCENSTSMNPSPMPEKKR